MTDETPVSHPAAHDLEWLSQPAGAPSTATIEHASDDEIASPETSSGGRTNRLKTAGIFVTALVVGAIGVFTLQSSSASPQASNSPGGGLGAPPGANGQLPGGRFGGVQGTVTAVSSSSITVAGTAYTVSSGTQVVVNGNRATIAEISKGDTVMVRADGTAAETIIAGSFGPGGPGGFRGHDRLGPDGQQQGGTQGTQPGAQSGTATGTTSTT